MTEQNQRFDPAEELKKAKLNPLEEIEIPPTVITQNGKDILHLGSYSVIGGKAKARKGFYVGAMATTAAIGKSSIEGLKGYFIEGKKHVLVFDTEQGKYWGSIAHKRICKNMEISNPTNLHYFDLQGYSPEERLRMIEYEIMNRKDILLVIIDGIRDIITSINEESEATAIITKLLRWCTLQIHIIVVLHQNKNDNNLRGHVGTELVNKAELVFSVTKDQSDKSISTVNGDYDKGGNFNSFSFCVGDDGLPRLTEVDRPAATKKADVEMSRFEYVFKGHQRMNYALMVERFKEAAAVETSSAKKHIAAALVKGIIYKESDGHYTFPQSKTESNDDDDTFLNQVYGAV